MAYHNELLDIKRWEVHQQTDMLWIVQAIIGHYLQHQSLGNKVMIIFEARSIKDGKTQRDIQQGG